MSNCYIRLCVPDQITYSDRSITFGSNSVHFFYLIIVTSHKPRLALYLLCHEFEYPIGDPR